MPGPAGNDDLSLALSAAHARIRFFGPHTGYVAVDEALAGALRADHALSAPDLEAAAATAARPLLQTASAAGAAAT